MANENLKQLMKLTEPMYAEGAPVLLEACALYADNTSNGRIAQLKWLNLDPRTIKALSVTLHGFDTFGNSLACIEFHYDELDARTNQEFGSRTAIQMGDIKADSYSVQLNAVAFSDGSLWKANGAKVFEKLPEAKPVELGSLTGQYLRDLSSNGFGDSGICLPQQALDIWQCGCGRWNKTEKCFRCQATLYDLMMIGNQKNLNKSLEAYEEQEKRKAEQQRQKAEKEKQKAEQEKRRAIARQEMEEEAKRQRKARKRKSVAIFIILVLLAAAVYAYINYGQYEIKYRMAAKLVDEAKFDEAIAAFEALGDYSDSAEQVKESKYKKAVALRTAGKYDEAISAFIMLNGYSDSAAEIKKCKYSKALALQTSGKYDEAIAAFEALDGYSDSAARIAECKKQKAAAQK